MPSYNGDPGLSLANKVRTLLTLSRRRRERGQSVTQKWIAWKIRQNWPYLPDDSRETILRGWKERVSKERA